MNKAIILLSGTPAGKSKFIENAKMTNWLWNVNFKDFLGTKANGFYWDGVRDDSYYDFTLEFSRLVNKYFNTEEKYLREKIDKFLSDDNEEKKIGNSVFKNFVLIMHGVSKELVPVLESDYGVFQVHVSRRDLNSNIELYDIVLYEDDENFESEIVRVMNILTKEKESA